jgi:MFS family permease
LIYTRFFNYAAIGVAAPLILVLLRLGQGLGVGGEWGGSVLLALEYGYKRNRGFWASWPQMGVPVGLVASTIVVNIVQATSGSNFTSGAWNAGWRIPFFVSALLIIVGLYIRLRIMETPLFTQVKEQKQKSRSPVIDAFRHSTREILLSAGARFVEQAPFYLFTVFVITYGTSAVIHLDRGVVLNAITIGAILELFTIPFFGFLSDRVGRRLWYLIGCVLMAAFAFPYFMLMNSASAIIFSLAVILSICFFHAWVYGPQAALIAERFGTRARYSAASMGYQLAAPFAGGLAPIIALLLLKGETNLSALGLSHTTVSIGSGSWQNVSIYMIILAAISFVSVLGLKELTRADISSPEAYNITTEEPVLVGEARED